MGLAAVSKRCPQRADFLEIVQAAKAEAEESAQTSRRPAAELWSAVCWAMVRARR